MKGVAILLVFFVGSICLQAQAYDDKGPWTKVKSIYAAEGKVFVYFEAGAMPGCYEDKGGYISRSNEAGENRMFSTVTAALLADRDVRVYYEFANEDPASWGRCNIVSVYIR